ncbi:hypothetical protein KCV00_g390, partial [Aureobasidium melanogenum]
MPTSTLIATSPSKVLTSPCPIVAMPVTLVSPDDSTTSSMCHLPQRTMIQLSQSDGEIFFNTMLLGTSSKIY